MFYTDGLIEDRRRDISDGLGALADVMSVTMGSPAPLSAERTCAAVQAASPANTPWADDVRLLAVRLTDFISGRDARLTAAAARARGRAWAARRWWRRSGAVRAAVGVDDGGACFAGEQHPGGGVPGLVAQGDAGVQAALGDPGQVEGGGAEHPDAVDPGRELDGRRPAALRSCGRRLAHGVVPDGHDGVPEPGRPGDRQPCPLTRPPV